MEGSEQISPPSPGHIEEEHEEQWITDHLSSRARFPSETESSLPPLPRREEPTLKEKLVDRERQARVETERARLKRQFALSSDGGAAEGGEVLLHRENGSVAGTVGEESSVAAPPTEQEEVNEEDDRKQLGYVMERFLRGDVKQEEEQVEKPSPEPGVLMERFLAEPVVVEQHDAVSTDDVDQHVDFQVDEKILVDEVDMLNPPEVSLPLVNQDLNIQLPPPVTDTGPIDSHDDSELETTAGSIRSYSTVTNASLAQVGAIDVDAIEDAQEIHTADGSREHEESSHQSSADEPRVFRLTEAEIQEMAAIEEASIGNAPPSERDDTFSEVGDLVGDLGAPRGLDPVGDFSAGTTTTALESASITSAAGDDLSDRSSPIEIETQSVDAIETVSVSSHLVVSPGASSTGSMSITAAPPSVTDAQDPSMLGPDGDVVVALPHNDLEGSAVLEMLSFEQNEDGGLSLECAPSFEDNGGPLDMEAAAAANAGIANRRSSSTRAARRLPPAPDTPGAPKQKKVHIMLDGFDFDKNTHGELKTDTTHSRMDSYDELPGWSPPEEVALSPLQPVGRYSSKRVAAAPKYLQSDREDSSKIGGAGLTAGTYGSVDARGGGTSSPPNQLRLDILKANTNACQEETLPLVENRGIDGEHEKHPAEFKHAISNVFSSLRSDSTTTVEAVNTDSEQYLATGIFKRAFPERYFALLVTLIVEIPVLLMISGGSDRLCMLVGRRRYQLMMGFLPLSSAISGNVGLQASTLTTRAVSHDHVTKSSYMVWLVKEVAAAGCLGLGMGIVLGTYAYIVSGMDYAFGLTIFVAQFVSIVTAGLTGTLAPLIFTFIFHRDSALYGGPLETAIQDIVGSFAMVILSYQLLVFFGPMEITPDDICGQQD